MRTINLPCCGQRVAVDESWSREYDVVCPTCRTPCQVVVKAEHTNPVKGAYLLDENGHRLLID